MSAESNKALIRRIYEEFWGQKNLAVADELVHTGHDNRPPGSLPEFPDGLDGFKQVAQAYHTAFPDLQVSIVEQVAEGNAVATYWTAHGTNTGSLFGKPATNKAATFAGMSLDHVADGKIVNSWTHFDQLGMLQQLGVLPS